MEKTRKDDCQERNSIAMTTQPTNSIDSELEEILSDLIYDTPNHYGYPPDFEPDFKKALQSIKALYVSRKEVEEAIDSMYEWSMTDLEKWEYQHKTEKPLISKTELRAKLLPPTKGEKL